MRFMVLVVMIALAGCARTEEPAAAVASAGDLTTDPEPVPPHEAQGEVPVILGIGILQIHTGYGEIANDFEVASNTTSIRATGTWATIIPAIAVFHLQSPGGEVQEVSSTLATSGELIVEIDAPESGTWVLWWSAEGPAVALQWRAIVELYSE